MQIFRHIPTQQQQPCALAIGNFDGMHLGHQALLQKLNETAKALNLTSAVMTFEPHPREFFAPETAPARLSSLREKLEHFAEAGVETTYVCRFNRRLAKLTPQEFIQNILRDSLNAQAILVGDDFRFGAMRAGSVLDFLEAKFNLISLPQVDLDGARVSSTRVRSALATGALHEASVLLGRPYSMSGKVVHGAKLGRQLGFPTANVHMRHERPALTGVYAVKLDGMNSVANLGVRPTVGGISKLMLEVNVLDFNADLYGKHVHVEFLHKIRDEQKFDGLDALKTQIALDVESARDFFKK
ncbi:bifunctional riboflavin kinase/FAD synthetase [Methylotenera sp.]|uniref:bifunctional riboflavin kinase/FAD synthetase n=1 Tax=Methylotenera sp. TaxID=2051956 RepID=UPI0024891254|nr:bifunctional riboflavin kinase/FAD synthetase [Methylotenera sp.]MDI1362808.1 bifunctional riboflavin kinase/FAD synthetase [Methylotenera sp.]